MLNPLDEDRSGPDVVTVKPPPYYVKAPYYKAPAVAVPDLRRFDVWAAGYGGQERSSGDFAAGTHDSSARTFGFAAGVDYRVSSDTRVELGAGRGRRLRRISQRENR